MGTSRRGSQRCRRIAVRLAHPEASRLPAAHLHPLHRRRDSIGPAGDAPFAPGRHPVPGAREGCTEAPDVIARRGPAARSFSARASSRSTRTSARPDSAPCRTSPSGETAASRSCDETSSSRARRQRSRRQNILPEQRALEARPCERLRCLSNQNIPSVITFHASSVSQTTLSIARDDVLRRSGAQRQNGVECRCVQRRRSSGCTRHQTSDRHNHSSGPKRNKASQSQLTTICTALTAAHTSMSSARDIVA